MPRDAQLSSSSKLSDPSSPPLATSLGTVPPTVLVLDGEQRSALAVVRSLGRHGCAVHVASHIPESLAGGSRFAVSESLLPDPLGGGDPYCAAVIRIARNCAARVVLPITEASTLALLEPRRLFEGIEIPGSDLAHFRQVSDKAAVLSLARTLGIGVPAQWTVPAGNGAIPELPPEEFPVVVKPSRSVVGGDGRRRKTTVLHADSPERLQQVLSIMAEDDGPLLLQHRIEGPGLGVFLLRWEGKIVAAFAHRRIREKPPSGGVSTCCESVALPPELLAQSVALLEALDWSGVAMIEYKQDARSGRNYLMEINPRFWGSLQLAIDSGVDFPWYLVQLAVGHDVEPVRTWRVGVRSRWLLGELDHLIARIRRSAAELDLPGDAPGVLRTAASVLTPWQPGQRNDVFRLSDPVPAFREALAWLRAL